MSLVDIASHSSSRWALPFVIFGVVYGIFTFLDKISAAEARASLSSFLRNFTYESYLGSLPEIIQGGFNRLFGERHFSRKCIVASILLSVVSLFVIFSISFVWNYDGMIKIFSEVATAAQKLRESDNVQVKKFVDSVSNLPSWIIWSSIALSWVIWCLLPDYISLLRVRIILVVIRYTHPRIFSLMVTGAIDFVLGLIVFMISFSLIQCAMLFFIVLSRSRISKYYNIYVVSCGFLYILGADIHYRIPNNIFSRLSYFLGPYSKFILGQYDSVDLALGVHYFIVGDASAISIDWSAAADDLVSRRCPSSYAVNRRCRRSSDGCVLFRLPRAANLRFCDLNLEE